MKFSKISKQFVILFFPIALMGAQPEPDHSSWVVADKKGSPVTLEWHKVTDEKAFFDLWEVLIPTFAESFADQMPMMHDFLLDDKMQIKKEYVEVIEKLSQEKRESIQTKLKLAVKPREARVKYVAQKELQELEQNRAALLTHSGQDSEPGVGFVVIARNESNDILGFATFVQRSKEDIAANSFELDILAIAPIAQGRGLARPLVFSILKLAPTIKRIYLGTRPWNTKAQGVYKALGLKEFHPDDSDLWVVWFEYVIKN